MKNKFAVASTEMFWHRFLTRTGLGTKERHEDMSPVNSPSVNSSLFPSPCSESACIRYAYRQCVNWK